MTGKKIENTSFAYDESRGDRRTLLEVKKLTRKGQFQDVNFSLRSGEILGITGLLGSGRTELALALFGLNKADSGEVLVAGRPAKIRSPRDAARLGISYLPEDRLNQGLFITQTIGRNIIVTVLKKILSSIGLISAQKRDGTIRRWVEGLEIKTPTAEAPAQSLSGGNQQRVVLAKWLATEPKIFILDGPTIGVDIASKSNIHGIIRGLAEKGMGIVIISDEIPEVLQNCSRILVMSEGRIIKEYPDTEGLSEDALFAVVSGKEGVETG
jgi:simple sugar transport system ATP-binding protein